MGGGGRILVVGSDGRFDLERTALRAMSTAIFIIVLDFVPLPSKILNCSLAFMLSLKLRTQRMN